MHDGQNLFDEATSYAGEWQVDETMQALSTEGLEAMVVGVPNMDRRRVIEYTPFRVPGHRTGLGEAYLTFLTETVKPLIDRSFRTLPDREHTGIMGSSLGGLISLYAFFRYPQAFGLAGAMSPALQLGEDETFGFIRAAPCPRGRIYLDVGTREAHAGKRETQGMRRESSSYLELVRSMRDLLVRKGCRNGADLQYVEDQGGIHHESAWARRLPGALRFLLEGLSA
jgi:predicted alpha/beta superfamily hydrolase